MRKLTEMLKDIKRYGDLHRIPKEVQAKTIDQMITEGILEFEYKRIIEGRGTYSKIEPDLEERNCMKVLKELPNILVN